MEPAPPPPPLRWHRRQERAAATTAGGRLPPNWPVASGPDKHKHKRQRQEERSDEDEHHVRWRQTQEASPIKCRVVEIRASCVSATRGHAEIHRNQSTRFQVWRWALCVKASPMPREAAVRGPEAPRPPLECHGGGPRCIYARHGLVGVALQGRLGPGGTVEGRACDLVGPTPPQQNLLSCCRPVGGDAKFARAKFFGGNDGVSRPSRKESAGSIPTTEDQCERSNQVGVAAARGSAERSPIGP